MLLSTPRDRSLEQCEGRVYRLSISCFFVRKMVLMCEATLVHFLTSEHFLDDVVQRDLSEVLIQGELFDALLSTFEECVTSVIDVQVAIGAVAFCYLSHFGGIGAESAMPSSELGEVEIDLPCFPVQPAVEVTDKSGSPSTPRLLFPSALPGPNAVSPGEP